MLLSALVWFLMLWQGTLLEANLLFPASSVLQITSAVSAPIVIPGRRIFWDWGIQMNYDMPSNLKQFQNVPIWPGLWNRKRRHLSEQQKNESLWSIAEKYHPNSISTGRHPSDFTAGEFYFALENLLTSYGFHETCLLRSVCELARHPFDDDQQNLLTEILTFILTPSLHNAFAETEMESMYRETYEQAEQNGFLHSNCTELYTECKQDLLTAISRVVTHDTETSSSEVVLSKSFDMDKLLIVLLVFLHSGKSFLLYPESTILQMIGSISVPINDLAPLQKIFFDWGFQMNYDMPFNLSSFYMVPIFPYARNHVSLTERDITSQEYSIDELYMVLENYFESMGFHSSCLKRSICELQQHPFEETHLPELTRIVTYFLTPSQIEPPRKGRLNRYTTAELQGLLGRTCEEKYPECEESFLSFYTKIY